MSEQKLIALVVIVNAIIVVVADTFYLISMLERAVCELSYFLYHFISLVSNEQIHGEYHFTNKWNSPKNIITLTSFVNIPGKRDLLKFEVF